MCARRQLDLPVHDVPDPFIDLDLQSFGLVLGSAFVVSPDFEKRSFSTGS